MAPRGTKRKATGQGPGGPKGPKTAKTGGKNPKDLSPSPQPAGPRYLVARGYRPQAKDATPSYRYRVDWSGFSTKNVETPLGLENDSRIDCYRNSAYQSLMSIPVLWQWLVQNHGPNTDCADDCPGCRLYQVLEEIYPTVDGDTKKKRKTKLDQKKLMRNIDNFFSDRDNTLKNKLPAHERGNAVFWDKVWPEKFGKGVRPKGAREGEEDPYEYLRFIQFTLMSCSVGKARQNLNNMFGLSVDTREICTVNNSHTHQQPTDNPQYCFLDLAITDSTGPQEQTHQSLAAAINFKWNLMTTGAKTCKTNGCLAKGELGLVTRIDNTPEVLFIALNRATEGAKIGGQWVLTKNEDDIEFDEILDLTNYLSVNAQKNGETARYRLSAVILHAGEGAGVGGHYISIVRGPTGICYQLDDYAKAIQASSLEKLLDDSSTDFVPVVLTYVKAAPDDKKKKKSGDEEEEEGSREGKGGSEKGNEGKNDEKGGKSDGSDTGSDKPGPGGKAAVTAEDISVGGYKYNHKFWKVDILRLALGLRGLPTGGKKPELLERLFQHFADEQNETTAGGDDDSLDPKSGNGEVYVEIKGHRYEGTLNVKDPVKVDGSAKKALNARVYRRGGKGKENSKQATKDGRLRNPQG